MPHHHSVKAALDPAVRKDAGDTYMDLENYLYVWNGVEWLRMVTKDPNKLTTQDYINRPLRELVMHPDFNAKAFSIITKLSVMTTEEIINLDIREGA